MKLWRRLIGLLLAATVCLAARTADAVIVYLKGQSQPVRGYFVRENDDAIVIAQLSDDGTTRERTIARAEIEDLLRSVSPDRLAALNRDNADGYREYAEELAEKRKDPDAQRTGLRLFQIAAFLEPQRLGRSCLLGMTSLARSAAERRRFRAMAYLLDSAHDPDLLKNPVRTRTPSTKLDRPRAEFLLSPLRLLRQGKRGIAMKQAKRVKLEKRLPLLTDTISYREFEQACAPICPYCERGKLRCSECRGKKTVLRGGLTRSVRCPNCNGQGRTDCPHCHGEYKRKGIPPSLLQRIIRIELDWLPGNDDAAEDEPRLERPSWSRSVQLKQISPVPPLAFATLTEFDPRQCHYRDGKWVDPVAMTHPVSEISNNGE